MADVDLEELGGRVLAIVGPFGSKAVVILPTDVAQEMFPEGLAYSGLKDVVAGVERDLSEIRSRDVKLAESGLAMTALALAYEMANPYTSATAKSMCAARIKEALDRLWELVPPKQEADRIDAARDSVARRRGEAAA